MKILVTGANGLLGSSLCPYLQSCGHQVLRVGRQGEVDLSVDLTDYSQIEKAFDQLKVDVIINLAAMTDVDACEANPQSAYRANTLIVENLGRWIRENRVPVGHLIQISTDQVYDGPGPHREIDACPANYYALSKYAGELAALRVDATVLRTNFFGVSKCPGRKTFSDWLIEAFNSGKKIKLFTDVWFSPLEIEHLCRLIEKVSNFRVPGIFNLGSKDGLSKADFAQRLTRSMGFRALNADLCSVEQAGLRAYRPKDMRMDVSEFESSFKVELPEIENTLNERILQ